VLDDDPPPPPPPLDELFDVPVDRVVPLADVFALEDVLVEVLVEESTVDVPVSDDEVESGDVEFTRFSDVLVL
jgi:hypothetical protein